MYFARLKLADRWLSILMIYFFCLAANKLNDKNKAIIGVGGVFF
jgi:hypothetical protein